MNRDLKLLCIGTLPFWVGIVLNSVLNLFPIPVFFFSVVYLLLWTYLCCRCCDPRQPLLRQGLLLCLFGFVMLVLVAYQECIRGGYWMNYFGIATQLYFLPALSFSAFLLRPFTDTIAAFPAYVAEMALMALCCFGGCLLKARKKNHRKK